MLKTIYFKMRCLICGDYTCDDYCCGELAVGDDVIEDLAWRTIRGEFGNGQERKRRLGKYYKAVQNEVNKLKDMGSW